MNKYTFFWLKDSPFSQWHPCRFTVDGLSFHCAEQYMMYMKAVLFADKETALKILNAESPNRCKALGRQVKNFSKGKWNQYKEKIVYDGNYAKFSQNEKLRERLFATAGTTLVEASPVDDIWGIGLAEVQARQMPPDKWPGQNLLGKALTQVRDDMMSKEAK